MKLFLAHLALLFFVFFSDNEISLSGKVLDKSTNKPLAEVVIIYFDPSSGQASGTITTEDGSYNIIIPKTVPVVTFSIQGYQKENVTISKIDSANYSSYDVFLTPNPK